VGTDAVIKIPYSHSAKSLTGQRQVSWAESMGSLVIVGSEIVFGVQGPVLDNHGIGKYPVGLDSRLPERHPATGTASWSDAMHDTIHGHRAAVN